MHLFSVLSSIFYKPIHKSWIDLISVVQKKPEHSTPYNCHYFKPTLWRSISIISSVFFSKILWLIFKSGLKSRACYESEHTAFFFRLPPEFQNLFPYLIIDSGFYSLAKFARVHTYTYHCTFDWILLPKEWVFLKSGIFALFSMIALNFDQSSRLWQS